MREKERKKGKKQRKNKRTNARTSERTKEPKRWRTAAPRPRRLLGQVEEGRRGDHVVEDGADAGRVGDHHHAEEVEEHHVAMAILRGVAQLLRHHQVLQHRQNVIAWGARGRGKTKDRVTGAAEPTRYAVDVMGCVNVGRVRRQGEYKVRAVGARGRSNTYQVTVLYALAQQITV